jgi:hypothetical protein
VSSVALALPGSRHPVHDVVAHRDEPATAFARTLSYVLQAIAATEQGSAVLRALTQLSDAVRAHGSPIDYQRRRRIALTDPLLDGPSWSDACAAARIPAGGSRNLRQARLWVWELLTGGLPEQAPASLRPQGRGDVHPTSDPLGTCTSSGNNHALVVPMQNHGEAQSTSEPLHTVRAGGFHHSLLMRNNRGGAEMVTPVTEPARSMTAKAPQSLLVPYNRTGQAKPVTQPAPTMLSKDTCGLLDVEAVIDDCGFRMLEPHEIAAAMAFPEGYIPDCYSKKDRIRLAGNAVTPPVMTWLVGRIVRALEEAMQPACSTTARSAPAAAPPAPSPGYPTDKSSPPEPPRNPGRRTRPPPRRSPPRRPRSRAPPGRHRRRRLAQRRPRPTRRRAAAPPGQPPLRLPPRRHPTRPRPGTRRRGRAPLSQAPSQPRGRTMIVVSLHP